MDVYHVWCNLREGVRDLEFTDAVNAYLGRLRDAGHIRAFRVTRRKLGLGPAHLPEFHVAIEVDGLAQLDEAFGAVSARADPVEGFHHAVNSKVCDAIFALYRDFPDPGRQAGEERF